MANAQYLAKTLSVYLTVNGYPSSEVLDKVRAMRKSSGVAPHLITSSPIQVDFLTARHLSTQPLAKEQPLPVLKIPSLPTATDKSGAEYSQNLLGFPQDTKGAVCDNGFPKRSMGVPFTPPDGSETMIKNGISQTVKTRHFCLTSMKAYENKSLEVSDLV